MKGRAEPRWIEVTDVNDVGGGITRIIELRRPAKLNCLSLAMLDELLTALESCAAGHLILTGAGRSFCTGLDLQEITGPDGGKAHLERLVRIYAWFLRASIPTLVLAKGHAAGGGAGLTACARTVVASADFRVRIPGGRLAGLAAVVIPIFKLRTQGKAPADHAWLGCDLDAKAAYRLGLVDRVIPPGLFEDLVSRARNGRIAPECFAAAKPNGEGVGRARIELDEFLRAWRRH
jgi:enoyl-CoA hydratase/carnithine racemase